MLLNECRLCGSEDIEVVVDLGYHPLADTFLPVSEVQEREVSFPLRLGACQDCGHVFTLCPVSKEDRYQKYEYSYDSSNSAVSVQHFKEFCDAVRVEGDLNPDSLIVDIGSNDGTLLKHFLTSGYRNVLGVEPSGNMAKIALDRDVPTIVDFFDEGAASRIRAMGKVQLLLSANVVNHADDLNALLRLAKTILAPSGRFVFEVPYLLDLVQRTAFDTIYHEHVHYYGLRPLVRCLQIAGFSIYRVERLEYMCGSIRVYARIGGQTGEEVEHLVAAENKYGLYSLDTYKKFMRRVQAVKRSINSNLWKIRAEGGKIIGIGAATKGNTLLNYCKLDNDLISYITDASPLKVGKMTPGSHIPIVSDSAIDSGVTHAVILPWNIAPFLMEKLAYLNVKFYVPQIESHAVSA
jgi:SAM-dependent methyltransferase